MTQHILITGGAGFIGSRLAASLGRAGDRVWIVDSLHPQVHGEPAKPALPPEATFVRADVTDADALARVVREAQPRVVYHLAAETGTGQSLDEVARYCEVNVTGTARLVEALRRESPRSTVRVVLAGSRAVYGEGGYRDASGREWVGLPRRAEAMRAGEYSVALPAAAARPARPVPSHAGLAPAPASIYASTKLMQEYLLRQAGENASWRVTVLRLQNIYGAGQSLRNPYSGVLSIFARQLLSGERIAVFEDGGIARDFLYVDDAVEALRLAGARDLAHGATLDVGSGEAVTLLDAARLLVAALERGEDALRVTGQFRAGDVRHACADIAAARSALGWEPRVDLRTGIRRLAEWARTEFQRRPPATATPPAQVR